MYSCGGGAGSGHVRRGLPERRRGHLQPRHRLARRLGWVGGHKTTNRPTIGPAHLLLPGSHWTPPGRLLLSWCCPSIHPCSIGVKIQRFYTQPLCTPARGAFLTGRAYHPPPTSQQSRPVRAWVGGWLTDCLGCVCVCGVLWLLKACTRSTRAPSTRPSRRSVRTTTPTPAAAAELPVR